MTVLNIINSGITQIPEFITIVIQIGYIQSNKLFNDKYLRSSESR